MIAFALVVERPPANPYGLAGHRLKLFPAKILVGTGRIRRNVHAYHSVVNDNTRAVLFAHRPLNKMDREDRIRACYLHACLSYVNREYMTNSTLRDRFGIDPRNRALAPRIIKETLESGQVRAYDKTTSRKYMRYVPYWA